TSASIEKSRVSGGSGKLPRIAWLPTTTIFRSPETSAAAVTKCSSSSRRTGPSDLLQDLAALGLAQQSGQRRVLAKIPSALVVRGDRLANLGHRHRKDLFPGLGVTGIDPPVLLPPSELALCLVDHRAPQSRRQDSVIGEAPKLRGPVWIGS